MQTYRAYVEGANTNLPAKYLEYTLAHQSIVH